MAKNFFDVNDNTLEPSEVHRKDSDELYETAFNKDQKTVLDNFTPGGGGGGGGSEPLAVRITVEADTPSAGRTTYALDKTWQEIDDAFPNVYLLIEEDNSTIGKRSIERIYADSSEPFYDVKANGSATSYETDSPSGYPSFIDGESQ